MAPPVIYSLNPAIGGIAGGTTVTIVGQYFTGATFVNFGGVPGTALIVVNDTTITVTNPGGTGIAAVTVITPNGASNVAPFTYIPYIAGLSPSTGPRTGGNTVIIRGSGFTGTTGVNFGGTPGTGFTVVNDTTITVVSPASPLTGSVSVAVVGPAGNSNGRPYIYTTATLALSPSHGNTGGGTAVAITGTNVGTATTVRFGTRLAPFIVNSPTLITATAPAGEGVVPVTVTNSGGTSAPLSFYYITSPLLFTVLGATGPAVGSTTNNSVLTLLGNNLTTTTGVTFTGVTNPVVPSIINDGMLLLCAPTHVVGSAQVQVLSAGGAVDGQAISYVDPPTITSLSPNTGFALGGDRITIFGTNLTNTTFVTFGGVSAASLSVVDDYTVVVSTPGHAAGTVDVVVAGLGGSVTAAGAFTFT